MAEKECPGGCHTLIPLDAPCCPRCGTWLRNYWEENPKLLARFAAPAIADLERLLRNHAAFHAWLTQHERL